MVYVVERYLPGLSRSDLLRGLSGLEQSPERNKAAAVRYLGSTIVLGDEACFCQFEGPSEAAVAEANRKAGLPFDRIVPAVTVMPDERRNPMSVSTPVPQTVEIRRSSLLGLVAAAAAVAAALTWAVLAFAVDTGSKTADRGPVEQPAAFKQFAEGISSMAKMQQAAAVLYAAGISPTDKRYVQALTSVAPVEQAAAFAGPNPRSIMDLTPGDLSAGGVWGYQLPSRQRPALGEVLASMSPESKSYVTSLMRLTFRQLAAGAAGSP